jgi:hypothetical protein
MLDIDHEESGARHDLVSVTKESKWAKIARSRACGLVVDGKEWM